MRQHHLLALITAALSFLVLSSNGSIAQAQSASDRDAEVIRHEDTPIDVDVRLWPGSEPAMLWYATGEIAPSGRAWETRDGYRLACIAPCTLSLSPGAYTFVVHAQSLDSFQPASAEVQFVHIRPGIALRVGTEGHGTERDVGVGLAITGAAAMWLGLLFGIVLSGTLRDSEAPLITGLAGGLGGVLLVGIGLGLSLQTDSGHLEVIMR